MGPGPLPRLLAYDEMVGLKDHSAISAASRYLRLSAGSGAVFGYHNRSNLSALFILASVFV